MTSKDKTSEDLLKELDYDNWEKIDYKDNLPDFLHHQFLPIIEVINQTQKKYPANRFSIKGFDTDFKTIEFDIDLKPFTISIPKIFPCDGFEYSYNINLPSLDFSAYLKSNELHIYQLAIENVAKIASSIWIETHFNRKDIIEQKKEDILNMQPINLPCPRTHGNVLIPLRFLPKVNPTRETIPLEIFNLLLDKHTRDNVRKNKICRIKQIHNQVIIRRPSKWAKELKKLYKHEWLVVDWLNKKWSVSIEKRSSLDYNAMLRLRCQIYHSEYGARTFQAHLRINPSSKNMFNLDLFNTSINALDYGSNIGRELLIKIFDRPETIISYFGKKRATHLEDLESAKEPYEAYNIVYLTLAAKVLKRRVKFTTGKLHWVAYTKNLKTKTPAKLLRPVLETLFKNRITDFYEQESTPKAQIEKMEEINVASHRFSSGFSLNNYQHKITLSIYIKDYYQYLSKLKRMTAHEKMKELPKKQLENIQYIRKTQNTNILRIEITIRGWEQIHQPVYFEYLDEMVDLIKTIDTKVSKMKNTSYITILDNLTEYFVTQFNRIKETLNLNE